MNLSVYFEVFGLSKESVLNRIKENGSLEPLKYCDEDMMNDMDFLFNCFDNGKNDKFAGIYFSELTPTCRNDWNFIRFLIPLKLHPIGSVYNFSSLEIKESIDYIFWILDHGERGEFKFKDAPPTIRGDPQFIRWFIINYEGGPTNESLSYFKYLTENLRDDKDFVLNYIDLHDTCDKIYKYITERLRLDETFTYRLLRKYNPLHIFPYSPMTIKNNIETVRKLILLGNDIYEFSSHKIRNNEVFAKWVLENNNNPGSIVHEFKFMSYGIRNSTKMIKWMIEKKFLGFFEYCTDEIKKNHEFVMELIELIDKLGYLDEKQIDYYYIHSLNRSDSFYAKWMIDKGGQNIHRNTDDFIRRDEDFMKWIIDHGYSQFYEWSDTPIKPTY
jgi:hypothetical protein